MSRPDVAACECFVSKADERGGGARHSRVAQRGDMRDPGPHRPIGLEGAHDQGDEGPKTEIEAQHAQAIRVHGRGLGGDGDSGGDGGAVHFSFHLAAHWISALTKDRHGGVPRPCDKSDGSVQMSGLIVAAP